MYLIEKDIYNRNLFQENRIPIAVRQHPLVSLIVQMLRLLSIFIVEEIHPLPVLFAYFKTQ